MARLLFRNAEILDPEAAAPLRGSLLVSDGRIEDRLSPGAPGPEDAETVDLAGGRLAPGFVDLHFHGPLIFCDPPDVAAALERTSVALARRGTTSFLVTTVAWSAARLEAFVRAVRERLTRGALPGAQALGIHLEGPWINAAVAGAQPPDGIRAWNAREGEDLLARAEGLIRLVTLAPELDGADALLDTLRAREIVAAIGHSLASADAIDDAVARGARHVTHLFNAMGPIHHREPGVPGHVLCNERLTCDLICDGVHVHPDILRLAAAALRERLVLITDNVEPHSGSGSRRSGPGAAGDTGFGSGELRDDGTALRLADGRLAGSSLTLERALRNAQALVGLDRLEAVAACTLRPARVLGCERERGSLHRGARADFVALDGEGRVTATWVAGRRVEARSSESPHTEERGRG